MKRLIFIALAINLLVLSEGIAQDAGLDCRVPGGMNLGHVAYYSHDWPFVDIMKMSRPWQYQNPQNGNRLNTPNDLPLRDDGYPNEVPYDHDQNPNTPGVYFFTSMFLSAYRPAYPTGTYTIVFEGQGTIRLSGDTNQTFTNAGRHQFQINRRSAGLLLSIQRSLPSNPIRNIRIMMPGFENNFERQVFHPLFIERLSNVGVLRFMDWNRTNHNFSRQWHERTLMNARTQAGENGVAYEYMIALANQTQKHAWINIPHRADDDYVRNLAILIRDQLNPRLKVYIEYSNEVWNWNFAAADYVTEQGVALGLSTNRVLAQRYFQARRSGEIFGIFNEVFGNTVSQRVIKVVNAQAGSGEGESAEYILRGFHDPQLNPSRNLPDALAIAPYMGNHIARLITEANEISSITVDTILNRLAATVETDTRVRTRVNKAIARRPEFNNIPLIAYEGGQHLVDRDRNPQLVQKIIDANRSPRMFQIYQRMLDAWKDEGGELFVNFSYVISPSGSGAWGLLEYQDQPIEEAHKFRAIQGCLFNNNTPIPPGSRPTAPQTLRVIAR